jgi:hypothetical protein
VAPANGESSAKRHDEDGLPQRPSRWETIKLL